MNKTAVPAEHARHDRVLVSRYAADDAYAEEVQQARALVELCPECARLAADIRVLSSALAESAAPRRTRDFQLSPGEADRLRGTRLDRLMRRFAGPRLGAIRPLAGVALSLGLAMAVVGAALPTPADVQPAPLDADQQFGAAAPDADDLATFTPRGMEAPGGMEQPAAEPMEGEAPADGNHAGDPLGAPEGESWAEGEPTDQRLQVVDSTEANMRNLLVFGGLAVALLSLAVLVLTLVARRRTDDPLLR